MLNFKSQHVYISLSELAKGLSNHELSHQFVDFYHLHQSYELRITFCSDCSDTNFNVPNLGSNFLNHNRTSLELNFAIEAQVAFTEETLQSLQAMIITNYLLTTPTLDVIPITNLKESKMQIRLE